MSCYAKVDGRPCRKDRFLVRCNKCRTISCESHLRKHGLDCGQYTQYAGGNPIQDHVTVLESSVEARFFRLETMMEKLAGKLGVSGDETSFTPEDEESPASELTEEPHHTKQREILSNAELSCKEKWVELSEIDPDCSFLMSTTQFLATHTTTKGNFFRNMDCRKCRDSLRNS